jgi:membrane-associated phospholipid phosphatase
MEVASIVGASLEAGGSGDSHYRKLDNIEEGQQKASEIEPTAADSWRSDLARHFAVFVVLLIWALCIGLGKVDTSRIVILERDPSISFPYVNAQFPVSLLVGFSVGAPCGFVVICATLVFRYNSSSKNYVTVLTMAFLLLTLAQCLLLADGITNTIKVLVLRPRPNFLAYCDYKGFQLASSSGNYTSYNLATQPNAVGSTSSCLSKSSLPDSVLSFPSGHSSLSFAGMTFVSLLLKHAIEGWGQFKLLGLHGAIVAAPLFLSSWVAITRIQDYFHHEDDVMMGSFIGASASIFVFNAAKPLLDGCGVHRPSHKVKARIEE